MNQLHGLCNLMHIPVSNVVFILAINPVQLVLLIVHMINRISRIKIVVHKAVIIQNNIALIEIKSKLFFNKSLKIAIKLNPSFQNKWCH